MNQIAIGDSSAWTVIDGQSVTAPYRKAAFFFNFGPGAFVREKIEIQLNGTPSNIQDALINLDLIALRALAYSAGEYTYPQYLRFQPYGGGSYYYALISEIHITQTPSAYLSHYKGSMIVELFYTRPNYFDGTQFQLPLTGRAGSEVTGGIQIVNHTDSDALDGSTLRVNAGDVAGGLPAPLRLEIQNNTAGSAWYRLLIGAFHHPTYTGEDIFFCQTADMVGGSSSPSPTAISGAYRTLTFTTSTFATFLTHSITSGEIASLAGRSFRPVLNLYTAHAYSDLHMRLMLRYSTFALHYSEAVYCDPNYQYVIFPPVQLPPNQILREVSPQWIDVCVQGLREGGAAATIYADQLMLLPVDYSLIFDQFIPLTGVTDKLIYDAHLGLSNVRYAGLYECVSHIRQGDPLLVFPNQNTRLFFNFYDGSNNLPIDHTAIVKAYYRPRLSML